MYFPAFGDFYQRFLLLLPFVTNFRSEGPSWSYNNTDLWKIDYKECGGIDQSPIAIDALEVIPVDLPPLDFVLYDKPFETPTTLVNNGHTVTFNVSETIYVSDAIYVQRPYIRGGLMEDNYEAIAVHFHWGDPAIDGGSEHKLNGRRYDLEMHIVHYNNKYFNEIEARNHPDGLAVLAVLFERTRHVFYQTVLSKIFDALPYTFQSQSKPLMLPSLGSLLGSVDSNNFYAYRGSLTTPPCSPSVLWHVFADVLPISDQELRRFSQLRDPHGQVLRKTNRPLQQLHNRQVLYRQPRGLLDATDWQYTDFFV